LRVASLTLRNLRWRQILCNFDELLPEYTASHSTLQIYCRENVESKGRAIAQALIRLLPTAAAQIRARAEHVGFVVDKVALGQVISEYFGFLCQSSFHQFLYHHNHPGLALPIGSNWTSLPSIRIKKITSNPTLYSCLSFNGAVS
jgi:hypothetical protein